MEGRRGGGEGGDGGLRAARRASGSLWAVGAAPQLRGPGAPAPRGSRTPTPLPRARRPARGPLERLRSPAPASPRAGRPVSRAAETSREVRSSRTCAPLPGGLRRGRRGWPCEQVVRALEVKVAVMWALIRVVKVTGRLRVPLSGSFLVVGGESVRNPRLPHHVGKLLQLSF